MSLYQETPGQDPYADAYSNVPQQPPAPASGTLDKERSPPPPARGRTRSRSPGRYRSPPPRRRSPPPRRPNHAPIVGGERAPTGQPDSSIAPQAPNPSNVLGVFGLSIRTQERDLDEEFSRFGTVEKVTIVYDQRSDRSRGFGFIRMATVAEASRCIQELNGVDLNGRRIRVDYSVTDRPHAPTPGTLTATPIVTPIVIPIATHTATATLVVEVIHPTIATGTATLTEETAATGGKGVARPQQEAVGVGIVLLQAPGADVAIVGARPAEVAVVPRNLGLARLTTVVMALLHPRRTPMEGGEPLKRLKM
ncbi:hypothetical protein JB92DRAFT_3109003 [Gautieria morchelliformis]|nr:hypothetical protein JB92DRAFT_3109003 [Gautieria morchelliformis]